MSKPTAIDEVRAELAELRAEIAELRALATPTTIEDAQRSIERPPTSIHQTRLSEPELAATAARADAVSRVTAGYASARKAEREEMERRRLAKTGREKLTPARMVIATGRGPAIDRLCVDCGLAPGSLPSPLAQDLTAAIGRATPDQVPVVLHGSSKLGRLAERRTMLGGAWVGTRIETLALELALVSREALKAIGVPAPTVPRGFLLVHETGFLAGELDAA